MQTSPRFFGGISVRENLRDDKIRHAEVVFSFTLHGNVSASASRPRWADAGGRTRIKWMQTQPICLLLGNDRQERFVGEDVL
jgi:hypothetical protein